MSPRPARPGQRAGYSVLEMLIVLAIMAISLAIILPRGSVMLDRTMMHVVFFEFQRDVSTLRREAYRSEQAVTLAASPDEAGGGSAVLRLRPSWGYRLDRPLVISPGGACSNVMAEIRRGGEVVMHLQANDGACHFIRRD